MVEKVLRIYFVQLRSHIFDRNSYFSRAQIVYARNSKIISFKTVIIRSIYFNFSFDKWNI